MASLTTLCLCMTCLGVTGVSFEVTILPNRLRIEDGLAQCADRNLSMTKYTIQEQETVQQEMRKQDISSAWLPIKNKTLGKYYWLDDQVENEKNWAAGKDCGFINLGQRSIDKERCNTKYSSICEKQGRFYYICEKHGWYAARNICQSLGGDLVVNTDTQSLFERAVSDSQNCQEEKKFWVGVRRSVWKYRDSDDEFFGKWGEGEPTTKGSCAIIQEVNGNFIVKVEDCKRRHPTICVRSVPTDQSVTAPSEAVEASSGVLANGPTHRTVSHGSTADNTWVIVTVAVVVVASIILLIGGALAVYIYRRKRKREKSDYVMATGNNGGEDTIPLRGPGIVIDTSPRASYPVSPEGEDTFLQDSLLRPNRSIITSHGGYDPSPYHSRASLLDDNNTWVIDSNGGEYKHNDEEVTFKVPSGAILEGEGPRTFRAEAEVDIFKHLTIGEEGRIISPVLKYQHGPLFHDLLTIDIVHRVTNTKLLQYMQAYYKRRDVSEWQEIQSKKKRRSSNRDTDVTEEDGEKGKKLVPDMYFEVTKSDVKIYTNQLGYFKVTCPAPPLEEIHLIGMIYADVNEDVSDSVSQEITLTVVVFEEMYNKKAIKTRINEKHGGHPIQDNISLTIKKNKVTPNDKLRFVLKPEKGEQWVLHDDQENEIQEMSLSDISQDLGEKFDAGLTKTLIQNQGKKKKTFLMQGSFHLVEAKDPDKWHTISKAVKCRVCLGPVEDDNLPNAENDSSGRGSSISTVHSRVVRPTGYHRFDRQFSHEPHREGKEDI